MMRKFVQIFKPMSRDQLHKNDMVLLVVIAQHRLPRTASPSLQGMR